MRRYLIFFLFLSISVPVFAQSNGDLFDTVYYDYHLQKVKRKYAHFVRLPAIKEGNRYIVSMYDTLGHPLYTRGYIPGVVDYHYSVAEGVGHKDGPEIAYYSDGSIAMQGWNMNDKPVGIRKMFDRKGRLVRKAEHDTLLNQVRRTDYNDRGQKIKEGTLLNNKKEGPWLSYFPDTPKLRSVVSYEKGKLNGPYAYYSEKTFRKVLKGQFEQNKKTGDWETYDSETGNLVVQSHYYDGYPHGAYKELDPRTGSLTVTGQYRNGYKTGTWKMYTPATEKLLAEVDYVKDNGRARTYDTVTGQLTREGTVIDEKREGTWKYYYSNGKLESTYSYETGIVHGSFTEYDSSGHMWRSGEYSKGLRTGTWRFNHEYSDKLWVEFHFKDDRKDGPQNVYYRTGAIQRKDIYAAGDSISSECYNGAGENEDCFPSWSEASFGEDIMDYIGRHMHYPEEARDAGIEGKVEVGFLVDRQGYVTDVRIIEGADESLNNEAMRVVRNMHRWFPAQVYGYPYKTFHTVPVVFWLPAAVEE